MDPSLPDLIRSDFLTCKICYELYKSPKLLPCLHSYCLACLESIEKTGSLHCPECRAKVEMGVASLKTNFFINSLLEVFKSKPVEKRNCTVCSSSQKAPSSGVNSADTSEFLCETCIKTHCSQGIKPELCCQEHQQKPMSFFCDTCRLPVCRECRRKGHLNHSVSTMTATLKKCQSEMKKLIDGLELNIKHVCDIKHSIAEEFEMFRDAAENIRLDIGRYIKKASVHLISLESKAYGILDQITNKNTETFASLEQDLQRQSDQAINTRDFSLKLMEMGKGRNRIGMEGILRDLVQDLKVHTPQKLQIHIPKLILILDEKEIPNIQFFKLELKNGNGETRSDFGNGLPGHTLLPGGNQPVGPNISTGHACSPTEDTFVSSDSWQTEDTSSTGDVEASASDLETHEELSTGAESHRCSTLSSEENMPFDETFSWLDRFPSESEYLFASYGSDQYFGDSYDSDPFDEGSLENDYNWVLSWAAPPEKALPEHIFTFPLNHFSHLGMSKITGVTVLKSGGILMADGHNDDIKIFSSDGHLSKRFFLPELHGQPPPCGITVCGNTLVCSAGSYLIFMTLGGKQLHNVKLRGNQVQYAITSYKSSYVVVSEGTHCSLALYEVSGHCLGRVEPVGYQGGKFLFVAVTSREVFIVSDFLKKTVVLFQKSGGIVNILDNSTPLLRDPFCVCVDGNDNIFVVDQNRVLEFTPDGVFGRVALFAKSSDECPRVIAVDRQRRLIIVQKTKHAKVVQL
ncbi:E3 ubiquitin-protein ligase TRIM56-like [Ambystoma mexicanum]|uniref:E3 ubiquitin-protein ligase TRIM56-like n=1 Tax=Ambystoma mexicanum TaxID=8296 RepID=UPI0037E79B19